MAEQRAQEARAKQLAAERAAAPPDAVLATQPLGASNNVRDIYPSPPLPAPPARKAHDAYA